MTQLKILVIEDGWEYSRTLQRFLGEGFALVRAGDGPEALAALAVGGVDRVFLDMRFDRVPADRLLGDWAEATARCNGDRERARRFLEDHQGTFILAALRGAGCALPVVFSYDFDSEPRRFKHLAQRFGPLDYVSDNADPAGIRAALIAAGRA